VPRCTSTGDCFCESCDYRIWRFALLKQRGRSHFRFPARAVAPPAKLSCGFVTHDLACCRIKIHGVPRAPGDIAQVAEQRALLSLANFGTESFTVANRLHKIGEGHNFAERLPSVPPLPPGAPPGEGRGEGVFFWRFMERVITPSFGFGLKPGYD